MIRLENVNKTYKGKTKALKQVSCNIPKGEFVFLVGPSGSGKSTLLRILTRQERADDGDVFVGGKNVNKLKPWSVPGLRRTVGCVFQDFKLLANKNAYQNVSFALEVMGHSNRHIKTQVPVVLDLVGLADKAGSYPEELSGGEQQRVAVARAFVNRPLILLADEPTGNLDPTNSVAIMKLLSRINQFGTTILMATHERGIVDNMRRRVLELSHGELVRDQEEGTYR